MERFVKYGSDLKGMNLIFIRFIRYKRVLGSLRFNKRFWLFIVDGNGQLILKIISN